mgnify:CR=1 FL=1
MCSGPCTENECKFFGITEDEECKKSVEKTNTKQKDGWSLCDFPSDCLDNVNVTTAAAPPTAAAAAKVQAQAQRYVEEQGAAKSKAKPKIEGFMGNVVKDTKNFISEKFANRMVQLSVYAGVLFYIVANPTVFKFMESLLPGKITSLNQLMLHAVLFSVLMYLGTTMLFDPVLKDLGIL